MKKHAAEKPTIAPAVMTVREVSGYLRVHPSTIYRLLKRREIPAFRIDGDWRFHIKAIDTWRSQKELIGSRPRKNPGNEQHNSSASRFRDRARV